MKHVSNVSTLLAALCVSLLALPAAGQAQTPSAAQSYPAKPVKLMVGFAPGGAADYVARSVGDALGRALGQSIVIENKAGAGSSIAAEAVAKAAPDGYTVLIASPSSISVNPALNPSSVYKLRASDAVLTGVLPLERRGTAVEVVRSVTPGQMVVTVISGSVMRLRKKSIKIFAPRLRDSCFRALWNCCTGARNRE